MKSNLTNLEKSMNPETLSAFNARKVDALAHSVMDVSDTLKDNVIGAVVMVTMASIIKGEPISLTTTPILSEDKKIITGVENSTSDSDFILSLKDMDFGDLVTKLKDQIEMTIKDQICGDLLEEITG